MGNLYPGNIHLSKVAIATLEKGVKCVQSWQEKHQNDVIDVALVFLLLTLTHFTPFSIVSVVDFEEVNISWA